MICPKCGNQIPDAAKFCPKCGAQLVSEKPVEPQTIIDFAKTDKPNSKDDSSAYLRTNRASGKMKIPKYVIMIIVAAVAAIVLIVVGVRIHSNRTGAEKFVESIQDKENSDGNTAAVADEKTYEADENIEEDDNGEEAVAEPADEEYVSVNLTDNVTITDVTVTPFFCSGLYSGTSIDKEGYAIGMTVSNGNDVSCDIYPSIEATVTDYDDYGDSKTEKLQLRYKSGGVYFDSKSIYSPYAAKITSDFYNIDPEYMIPVGLAPNETKTVFYYIDAAVCRYADDLSYGDFVINFATGEESVSIESAEVVDFYAEESDYEYIAVGDCIEETWVQPENAGLLGYCAIDYGGSIVNNTSDRWSFVYVNLDMSINGYKFSGLDELGFGYEKIDYVDIGDTVNYSLVTDSYQSPDDQLEAVPALVYYRADKSDFSDWVSSDEIAQDASDPVEITQAEADTEAVESDEDEANSDESADVKEVDDEESLNDNITITDITFTPYHIDEWYGDWTSDFQLYAIGMTISNENDVSCDVSPLLQVTWTATNGYGDQKVETAQVLGSTNTYNYNNYSRYMVYSPYSREVYSSTDTEYLVSVGLAPHETKTVYYYIDKAVCRYPDSEDGNGFLMDFGEDSVNIESAEVVDFKTNEADVNYIPVNEWGENIWAEPVYRQILSGYTFSYGGTVTNNTDVRWENAQVNLDIRIDGEVLNGSSAEKYATQELKYINAGETVEYSGEGDMDLSLRLDGQIEALPALLYYVTDDTDYSEWQSEEEYKDAEEEDVIYTSDAEEFNIVVSSVGTDLDQNVTITDVTVTPYHISAWYAGTTSDFESYAIGMTITNDNDESCDIYPAIQISRTVTNGYGEKQSQDLKLLCRADVFNFKNFRKQHVYSPYSRQIMPSTNYNDDRDEEYMIPVGLAPHETKTVYYYIDKAACRELGYGEDEADEDFVLDFGSSEDSVQIDSAKVVDFYTEESPVEYVSVEEAASSVQAEVFGSNINGYNISYEGEITNNTSKIWASATINLDLRIDGSIMGGEKMEMYASQTLYAVRVGNTSEYSGEGLSLSVKSDSVVEAYPALLYCT